MRRREFLASAAAAMTAAGSPTLWAQTQTPAKAKQSTLDRIAIMTLNFQRILKVPDVQDSPERTLDLFDIGEMIADKYGVHKVEFQHYHIASTEPSYLKELRSRLEKAKSRATQINLEFSGLNMSAPRLRDRLMAIDLTKAWVDHAVLMGAQRVMVNQGARAARIPSCRRTKTRSTAFLRSRRWRTTGGPRESSFRWRRAAGEAAAAVGETLQGAAAPAGGATGAAAAAPGAAGSPRLRACSRRTGDTAPSRDAVA